MNTIYKFKFHILVWAVILVANVITEQALFVRNYDYELLSRQLQENLWEAQKNAETIVQQIDDQLDGKVISEAFLSSLNNSQREFQNLYFSLLVYNKDKLVYWSNNKPAINNPIVLNHPSLSILHLKNGWFLKIEPNKNQNKEYRIIGLLRIKKEYPYENSFLQPEFNECLHFKHEAKISLLPQKGYYNIYNKQGKVLFAVQYNGNFSGYAYNWLIILVYAMLFISMIYFLHHVLKEASHYRLPYFLLANYLLVFAFRIFTTAYQLPPSIYNTRLFDPNLYGSEFFSRSLGDLLINVIIALHISFLCYRYPKHLNAFFNAITINKLEKFRYVLLLLVPILLFPFQTQLLKSIVLDSVIPLNFFKFYDLNFWSAIEVFIIFLLFVANYLFFNAIARYLKQSGAQINILQSLLASLASAIILNVALKVFFGLDLFIVPMLLGAIFMAIIFTYCFRAERQFLPSLWLFLVICFSVFVAYALSLAQQEKELEYRKLVVIKLAQSHDYVAEQLFIDVQSKLLNDTLLRTYLNKENSEKGNLDKRLNDLYFNGYWHKYRLRYALYDSSYALKYSSDGMQHSFSSIDTLIATRGKASMSKLMWNVSSMSGQIYYIAIIPLADKNKPSAAKQHLVINISNKAFAGESGFYELSIAGANLVGIDLNEYSYARYYNNSLTSRSGSYVYFQNASIFGNRQERFYLDMLEGYCHLVYKPDAQTRIVISKADDNFLRFFTNFSFIFFILFLFSSGLLIFLRLDYWRDGLNFKRRIQLSVVSAVLLIMGAIAVSSVLYLRQEFDQEQDHDLNERTNECLQQVEKLYEKTDTITYNEKLTQHFNQIAANHNTDFNVYGTNGQLAYSSQSKIYEQGLISDYINNEAFTQFNYYKVPSFRQTENIGELHYVAEYRPIRNISGNTIGFININYFQQYNHLPREISSFIVTLLNVYTIMFMLAISLAYIVAQRITRPLKLVEESMAKVRLGKTVQHLSWHNAYDEIGQLVYQYNKMVDEISRSATALAKTERESAWREMAKQVAHEIKNPLTPMKLSLQHLQRAVNDKHPDINTLFSRIADTLIQQIDTLSGIASAFANFAQMPKSHNQELNLKNILKDIVTLYEQTNNVSIDFKTDIKGEATIFADVDQVGRIFSNIVKNAIQAVPEERSASLHIDLFEEQGKYLVAISDNGLGISQQIKEKIFIPNFTTKTTGTGLGLAMVKNMVDSMQGEIWFESTIDVGTTFFVRLPKKQV